MKKILTLILAAIMMILACVSCGTSAGVKLIGIELTEEQYAFGVDKDQPELLQQVNDFLDKIMENGTFDEICNKYFADGTPTPVTSAALDESKDQLVVATNAAFAPFEYMDGENYLGIDMEIMAMFAKEIGKELVISNMDFESVCLSVGSHKCDIAAAGLTVNTEREEFVTFSKSYYNASQMLIVKEDDTTYDACADAASIEAVLNGLDKNYKIGVQLGTTGQLYVEGDADWGFDGFGVTCVGYKNGSLAVQDLINGNVNAVIIDSAPAEQITAAFNEMK